MRSSYVTAKYSRECKRRCAGGRIVERHRIAFDKEGIEALIKFVDSNPAINREDWDDHMYDRMVTPPSDYEEGELKE